MVRSDEVTLDIHSIFAPIERDLQKLELSLQEASRAEFGPLADVIETTIESGGKRIRPALVLLSGRFHPVNEEHLLLLATAVELLHDATLIHDDLLDKSRVRRGVPTVSSRWSEKATVLAGDFLLARSAKLSARVGNFEVMQIISEAVAVICEGEIRQDFGGGALVTERGEYYDRIYAKTASLFAAATECAAVLSHAPETQRRALREYGHNLGMAFQITDDVLDFVATEREVGKPVGSDLRQGLATLPTIYFYEQDPRRGVLTALFSHNGHSPEQFDRVIDWIRSSPAIQAAQAEARALAEKAQRALDILPDNPYRASLYELANYVVERKK
jgi:geranylgeranyl pyrophosphate synthase